MGWWVKAWAYFLAINRLRVVISLDDPEEILLLILIVHPPSFLEHVEKSVDGDGLVDDSHASFLLKRKVLSEEL